MSLKVVLVWFRGKLWGVSTSFSGVSIVVSIEFQGSFRSVLEDIERLQHAVF